MSFFQHYQYSFSVCLFCVCLFHVCLDQTPLPWALLRPQLVSATPVACSANFARKAFTWDCPDCWLSQRHKMHSDAPLFFVENDKVLCDKCFAHFAPPLLLLVWQSVQLHHSSKHVSFQHHESSRADHSVANPLIPTFERLRCGLRSIDLRMCRWSPISSAETCTHNGLYEKLLLL